MSKNDDRILTKEGFVDPSIGGEYKYYIRRHIHVLKLETFLVKPDDVAVVGNHRNGVKHDNELENLEWTTYSGNLIHAYQNGLRSDNLVGFLKDLVSGEVRMFNTLREISDELDVYPPVVTRYINGSREAPIKFKYAIWLLGEDKTNLTKDDIGKVNKGGNRPLVFTNQETGETKYFAFVRSALKHFDAKYRELVSAIDAGKYGVWKISKPADFEEYLECLNKDEMYQLAIEKQGLRMRMKLDRTTLAPQA